MSVKLAHELKRLQSDKERVESEVKQIKQIISESNKKVNDLNGKKKGIEKKIEALAQKDIIVTEHALLRYIERIYGLNLEELKNEILTDESKAMIKFANGNGKFTLNGVKLIVKNSTVVTVE